jgi:hypothetical protein
LNDKQRTHLRGVIKKIERSQRLNTSPQEKADLLQSAAAIVKAVVNELWAARSNLPVQFQDIGPGQEILLAADQLETASDLLAAGNYRGARAEIAEAIKVPQRIS